MLLLLLSMQVLGLGVQCRRGLPALALELEKKPRGFGFTVVLDEFCLCCVLLFCSSFIEQVSMH